MIDNSTSICNKILKSDQSIWTISLVISLTKKEKLQNNQPYQPFMHCKVMLKIIQSRHQPQVEKIIVEEQAGFQSRK